MAIKIELKENLTKEEYDQISQIYAKTFTIKNEFTETNLSLKNCNKLFEKFPKSSALIKDNKKTIGQTWIVPTNRKIMTEFLENKITEQEMVLKSLKKVSLDNFNCIYLFYSSIFQKYRRQGLIFKARIKTLNHYIKFNKKIILFAWVYSKEGENLAIKTAEKYKLPLIIKK
ncbi:hypothetical protein GW835_01140 [archaeon]|nr:hypothetical protein [archaeon]NCP79158.1 hypothetical protein [archaeon]NCP97895.1 hypothetical protein [archaeon]NCQ06925.1 hypothetical protein [archaeon]NCQ50721.1 hypothetical protein [archaeon]